MLEWTCSTPPRRSSLLRCWAWRRTCPAILRSSSSSVRSRTTKTKSNRERSESGKPMLSANVRLCENEPYFGLAAAVTLHRAFNVVWRPAFVIVTLCCSIASWMATLSFSLILSNSSMQMKPLSASTMAPASMLKSLEPGSLITAAVRPTPDDPRPVVLMAGSATFITKRSIWDFPQDGSPTRSTLMSPRMCVPVGRTRSVPPIICRSRPALTFSCPHSDGANDRDSSWKVSSRLAMARMFLTSSPRKDGWMSSFTGVMLVAIILVGHTPVVASFWIDGKGLYTPATCTRSPGLISSARSPSHTTSHLRGNCPAGVCSGVSWTVNLWMSLYTLRPISISSVFPSLSVFGIAPAFPSLT
mmetsp:Transcript_21922/g.51246  ORF Transcript_21922/g.51246 Transcript_21922/m.51246 type:complete len:358 (-) Transcript_21922:584-1657(-)